VPPTLLERLALEFVFLVERVLVLFELTQPLRWMVLAQPRAGLSVDIAHLGRANRHQHVDKLRLINLARRLWCDRSCHVGRRALRRELSRRHAEPSVSAPRRFTRCGLT
jgi:hypothetical protein